MPNQIFPSLFCIPSTLYIVIGFCRGAGSNPTFFAHSKSMKQLVQPESIRAFVVVPFAVLRASRCTWMESSHGMRDSTSFSTLVRCFIGPTFLSFSSASIWVCLHCKIVYFGVLAVDTGMGRGLGYLHLRHQFGLTGPRLQILLLNRSLSLSLIQLQAVPEQCNLILIVFKTTTLAFHNMDLWPWDLWA